MIRAGEYVAPNEIVITRVFKAARTRVFDAWTAPERISRWWGPNGFTTTTHHMDVRPGGTWQHVMHGPDGTDYPNTIIYDEVARPDRLAYRNVGTANDVEVTFHAVVTFEDEQGGTRVTLRMVFPTEGDRDFVAERHGAVEGGHQTLGRLADFLESSDAVDEEHEVVASRVFDVPRERLFQAFNDPKALALWWGPNGFTNTIQTFEPRTGGTLKLVMHGPDGTDYPNERVFTEYDPPARIVMENRDPSHAFRMTMTYETLGQKTHLTWRMRFESAEELSKIRTIIVPACQENLDRLQNHVAPHVQEESTR